MADPDVSARTSGGSALRSRRRRRRRRVIVAATVGVVAVAGAGSAWAMSGTDSPTYRLAAAGRADVGQTVDADGTLSAADTAALSFAAAGTVSAVKVAVGDTVTAGQAVATLDPATLDAAVTAAKTALAQAKQTLANDQEAQLNGTTVSTGSTNSTNSTNSTGGSGGGAATTSGAGESSTVSVNSAVTVRLTAATKPVAPTSGATTTSARSAQQAVVSAQQALDKALTAQDSAVSALADSCAASDDTTPSTVSVTADADGTVAGTAGGKSVVTLRTKDGDLAETSSTNPQRVASGDRWSFAGLDAGTTYRVELVRSNVVDSDACTTAVSAVVAGQRDVDSAVMSLTGAITALDKAIDALPATGTSTGSGTGNGTTSGTTSGTTPGRSSGTTSGGSTTGGSTGSASGTGGAAGGSGSSSGSSTGSSTGVLVTAARIAADTKGVDAKNAALAVAKENRRHATLTTSLAGTVAAVAIATGDSVSASSSSATITVVGSGTLSSVVDVGIADIDLVKVGQSVAVSVDGRTSPLPGHVSFIGTTDSAGSSSSAASYPVTVVLDERDASLYDGMGAALAIDVGAAKNVLTVALSAVHTTGNRTTVDVYANGSVTAKVVTLGLVGGERVQLKSGLKAGDRVVLAEVSAAVPTSTTSNRRGGTGSVFGGGTAGGPPAGGGVGGR